jgi:hypothetical protein
MILAVEWGTVPEWLTLGTLLLALGAFVVERWDKTRTPACGVYAVVDHPDADVGPAAVPTKVQIWNNGDFPVFDVFVSVWDGGKRRMTWRFRRHEHWLTGTRRQLCMIRHVSPEASADADVMWRLAAKPSDDASIMPPIVIKFREGNGRCWVRWPDGQLTHRAPSRQPRRAGPPTGSSTGISLRGSYCTAGRNSRSRVMHLSSARLRTTNSNESQSRQLRGRTSFAARRRRATDRNSASTCWRKGCSGCPPSRQPRARCSLR